MKTTINDQISIFIKRITEKVCEMGGREDDLAHFFGAQEHRYYEEAVSTIASNITWLTPRLKPVGESFEVEVNYHPNQIPEEITPYPGVKVFCRKGKYFDGEMDGGIVRKENIIFQPLSRDEYPKRIRAVAKTQGLKACTILHALAIKKLAEMDSSFMTRILPFMPIHFIGAVYPGMCSYMTRPGGYKLNSYLHLEVGAEVRQQNRPLNNVPIILGHNKAAGHLYSGSIAFY